MKKASWIRSVAAILAVSLVLSTASCAYILKPEQRGNSQGEIDTTNLVFDILWLIPGLIPGVVALAVDFGNGAIYTGKGKSASYLVPNDGRIDVQLPALAQGAYELRLVDATGQVLAVDSIVSKGSNEHLAIDLGEAVSEDTPKLTLQLISESGEKAELPLEVAF